MQRFRGILAVLGVAAAIGLSPAARADAYADLRTALEELAAQPGVQAELRAPGQQTVVFESIGPDRMRATRLDGVSELVIGLEVWGRQNGTWQKMPPTVAGAMSSNMQILRGLVIPEMDKRPVKDLGMRKLNGGTAHVYAFTVSGILKETIWVGANGLPLQLVTETSNGALTITYEYDGVTIEPPE